MPTFIALLTSLIVLSLSLPGPVAGQSFDAPTPEDLVALFLSRIVVPAAKGQPPSDEVMQAFYNESLLNRTRVRVAEDQFIEYWKKLGTQWTGARPGFDTTIGYTLSEPISGDADSETIITADLAAVSKQSAGLTILMVLGSIGCVATGTYCAPMILGGGYVVDYPMTVVAVKQGRTWRLALPDEVVQAMEKLPTKTTARRLAVSAAASEGGVTLQVSEVAYDKDSTFVRLTVENSNDVPVNLLRAGAFATLTDDLGKTYNLRILKTQMPEGVPGRSTQTGQIGFDPVPETSRKLILIVPDVQVGDTPMTFRLEISLGP